MRLWLFDLAFVDRTSWLHYIDKYNTMTRQGRIVAEKDEFVLTLDNLTRISEQRRRSNVQSIDHETNEDEESFL